MEINNDESMIQTVGKIHNEGDKQPDRYTKMISTLQSDPDLTAPSGVSAKSGSSPLYPGKTILPLNRDAVKSGSHCTYTLHR